MEPLIIHSTDITVPSINLDPTKGEFRIQGRSTPDNPAEFFKPVFDFFAQYKLQPHTQNNLHIYLEYCNSSTSKCLFDIFNIFSDLEKLGSAVNIYWYYSEKDEDMLEMGKDFADFSNVEMKFVIAPKIHF